MFCGANFEPSSYVEYGVLGQDVLFWGNDWPALRLPRSRLYPSVLKTYLELLYVAFRHDCSYFGWWTTSKELK